MAENHLDYSVPSMVQYNDYLNLRIIPVPDLQL